MTFQVDDTIVAIASPRGSAARGIVRLSGPDVVDCLRRSFHPDHGDVPLGGESPADDCGAINGDDARWDLGRTPRVIAGHLPIVGTAIQLPVQLHLWPTRRSYTRQPSAELHTIGSPPLVDAAVETLCAAGARLAAPGEFTQRAFLAGRIDLAQAEAVLGVIDARDQRELDTALRQLAGGLSRPLQHLRDDLLNLLADLEAGLDFVEEDIEFVTVEQLDRRLVAALDEVEQLNEQISDRALAHDLPRVVLVGPPNVGKSSLWNALLGDAAAIVSPERGTTRDFLTRSWDIDGFTCLLVDTAGRLTSRELSTPDSVADAAEAMTEQQSVSAQLRIYCLDGTQSFDSDQRRRIASRDRQSSLVVVTKVDLPFPLKEELIASDIAYLSTSSETGEGMDQLRRAVRQHFVLAREEALVGSTAVRCRDSLRAAAASLDRARGIITAHAGEELVAAELRVTLDQLGKVVGAVYTEDLLDRIFSRFCIGK